MGWTRLAPFQVDWAKFTLQVPEAQVLAGHSPTLDAVMRRMHSPGEVAAMQHALAHARHDLLYGAGDPFAHAAASASSAKKSDGSSGVQGTFPSRAVDHLLQQAFELASLPSGTRYRRFKPAFSKCLDLTLSNS